MSPIGSHQTQYMQLLVIMDAQKTNPLKSSACLTLHVLRRCIGIEAKWPQTSPQKIAAIRAMRIVEKLRGQGNALEVRMQCPH